LAARFAASEAFGCMGELTIHWPDADAERVRAARGRLDVAGRRLRARSRNDILDALGSVFDLWCNAKSSWRRELLERLPAVTGFGSEVVRVGLDHGLSHWTGAALGDALRHELGPMLGVPRRRVAPFAMTSLSLAGCIPMPTLLQCVLPLAVQSAVLVKSASRDPVTPELVARSIASVDPELGHCIEVVAFPGDDPQCATHFLASECVVASGSDQTIGAIRARLRASQRFVGYGHKLSIAVVGTGATREPDLFDLARRLSLDVALWDQLGCLSPLAIYVVGVDSDQAAATLGRALAEALGVREQEMPRGEVDRATVATIRQARDEADMRAADGRRVRVHASEGSAWTVVVEDEAVFRGSPGHRFVRVHPVPDLDGLSAALRPIGRHLSAAAVAGFDTETPEGVLTAHGASRLCAPGSLQAPAVSWPHDGRPILLPLTRFTEVEAATRE